MISAPRIFRKTKRAEIHGKWISAPLVRRTAEDSREARIGPAL